MEWNDDATRTYGARTTYESEDGRLVVELTRCEGCHGAGSLMDAWVRNGRLPERMPDWVRCQVYYTDDEGTCWGFYNPQESRDPRTGRLVNDYRWILRDTPESRRRILGEVARMRERGIRHHVADYSAD